VLLLAYPAWFPAMTRLLDPHAERYTIAAEAERQQRAAGVPFRTASGELRRAVVYTPTDADEKEANLNFWTWAYRVWAAILAVMLLRELLQTRGAQETRRLD
jgi:hypothetical protein